MPCWCAGFQKNHVSWYGIMIIDICLLLSLALFTLPLYTITSHTLRADRKLLQQIVQQQQQQGGSHSSCNGRAAAVHIAKS
jgi:heme exporter protein D